jgi:hypothetical protein
METTLMPCLGAAPDTWVAAMTTGTGASFGVGAHHRFRVDLLR